MCFGTFDFVKVSFCDHVVADPRFLEERVPTTMMGVPTYYFSQFPQKLHEYEKNLDPGRGREVHVPGARLGSANMI